MVIAGSLFALVGALTLLILQVDPVPTWFYVFAWYPTLVIVDELVARSTHSTPLRRQPRVVASLMSWSVVIWLLFEAANFRLQNWYYVMLPDLPVERWVGIVLSFATVVPAVLLAERALAASFGGRWGGARGGGRRSSTIRPWQLRAATLIGVAAAVTSLAWPERWFPLIWGAAWLMADPWVYRRRPEWSLLGDVARGEWGRIGRLLGGGFAIGLVWEGFNYWARGRWIYTVPGLESLKLFEMPPLGFLGFPIFALEVWTLYHALCALGLATPLNREVAVTAAPGRLATAAAVGIAFSVLTLTGMERRTISSTAPSIADLPRLTAAQVARLDDAGITSPWRLAEVTTDELARRAEISHIESRAILESVQLTLLRGMGSRHASTLAAHGIQSVCDLARHDPNELYVQITEGQTHSFRPTEAEVRVWTTEAVRRCDSDSDRR